MTSPRQTPKLADSALRCPLCDGARVKVIDSRPVAAGCIIRRKRLCETCRSRFTTEEIIVLRTVDRLQTISLAERIRRLAPGDRQIVQRLLARLEETEESHERSPIESRVRSMLSALAGMPAN